MFEGLDWLAVGAILGPIIALIVGVWTQKRAAKTDLRKTQTSETESAILALKALNDALLAEIERLSIKHKDKARLADKLKEDIEDIRAYNASLIEEIKKREQEADE